MTKRLVADVGNTTVCWQIVSAGGEASQINRRPASEAVTLVVRAAAEASVRRVAAVVSAPELGRRVEEALAREGIEYLQVGRDLPVPIETDYYDPAEIGPDRLCNALAAREGYGPPVVSASAGTCLTVEAVNAEGRLVGGAIGAGVPAASAGIAATAPHLAEAVRRAAGRSPEDGLGRSTQENLTLGLWLGVAGALESLVLRARRAVGEGAPVVLTGGDAQPLAMLLGLEVAVEPGLTLQGVRLALEHASD
ncbi:MAG: type III pantothenate kinase [Armatimonadetes bacterium]|nr:type III pantothenate kinase [Armatimonadota bacterium]